MFSLQNIYLWYNLIRKDNCHKVWLAYIKVEITTLVLPNTGGCYFFAFIITTVNKPNVKHSIKALYADITLTSNLFKLEVHLLPFKVWSQASLAARPCNLDRRLTHTLHNYPNYMGRITAHIRILT